MVAAALLWLIVPSGAVVRLTASGLGCPDWPLCDGEVVPALSGHAAIEYGNRIFSAVVMAVCVVTLLVALRLPDRPAAIRRWSALIAIATVGQVPLGALTVLTDLHPLMVASHFLLSMVALAGGVLLVLHAWDRAHGLRRGLDRRRGPLAALAAAAFAAVLVTGTLVTASGPHSGDRDVVRRFWEIDQAAWVHVRAVVVFLVLAGVLAAWLWREGGVARATARLGGLTALAVAAQVAVGEYQYRNHLPWEIVTIHVSLAALAWALVVAFAWRVARPQRL